MNGQKAPLGPQGRLPSLVIGFTRSIQRSPAMAGDLSAYRRNRPLQLFGYLTNRRTGGNSSRDVLSLRQCERQQRAPTRGRSNPSVLCQHKLNGNMVLAKDSSNLMQRLSRFPTAPHGSSLRRRKPNPSPLRHKHHLSEKRFISDGVASTG